MIFPEVNLSIVNEENKNEYGKSFLYDFDKGDFILKDGKLVIIDDLEALKIWIDKILKTEKFRYSIYKSYGIKLEDLFGGIYDKSFLIAELNREIKDALTRHPLIDNITNVCIQQNMDKAIVSFKVITAKGNLEKEVEIHA